MKRTIVTLAAALAVSSLSLSVLAQPPSGSREATPATQPSAENLPPLPAGHPDIGAMRGAAQGGGGMGGQAAPGAMPGGMPAGHPDISSLMGGAAGAPAGQQPAAKVTSLTVQAVQATIGGPPIAGDDVRLEVFDAHTGGVVAKVEGKLNETGFVSIGGLPVGPALQPVVTVTHAGVGYRVVGEPINSAEPRNVTVKVYETTDRDPGWEVRMRHVMLQATDEGVQVMDMIAVDNASDRSFIGATGPDGARVTFALPIPANAKDVKFMEGFDDCCTKVKDGALVNAVAITPGTNQYQYTYFVPAVDGKAELFAAAPTVTKHLMIFAPEDGTTVTATGGGVESGVTDMGGRKVRYFKAGGVAANAKVTVSVSGKPNKAVGAASTAGTGGAVAASPFASADPAQLAKAVAGVGALLIVLFGGAVMLRKPAKAARTAA